MQKKGSELGNANCQNTLARYYFLGLGTKKDMVEALKWAEKAAVYSELQSANCLAGLLYADKSVGNDMEKAVYYFKKSTKLRESLEGLATCYSKGIGVPIDKKEAMEYEERASDRMKGALGGWIESYYDFVPDLFLY